MYNVSFQTQKLDIIRLISSISATSCISRLLLRRTRFHLSFASQSNNIERRDKFDRSISSNFEQARTRAESARPDKKNEDESRRFLKFFALAAARKIGIARRISRRTREDSQDFSFNRYPHTRRISRVGRPRRRRLSSLSLLLNSLQSRHFPI